MKFYLGLHCLLMYTFSNLHVPANKRLKFIGKEICFFLLHRYQEMPHTGARAIAQAALPQDAKKGTISQYFATSNCPICDQQTKQPICHRCMRDTQMVCVTLNDKITRWERLQQHLDKVKIITSMVQSKGIVLIYRVYFTNELEENDHEMVIFLSFLCKSPWLTNLGATTWP